MDKCCHRIAKKCYKNCELCYLVLFTFFFVKKVPFGLRPREQTQRTGVTYVIYIVHLPWATLFTSSTFPNLLCIVSSVGTIGLYAPFPTPAPCSMRVAVAEKATSGAGGHIALMFRTRHCITLWQAEKARHKVMQ